MLPFVPSDVRQTVRSRATTTSALLCYRRPMTARSALMLLGGVAFSSVSEERTFTSSALKRRYCSGMPPHSKPRPTMGDVGAGAGPLYIGLVVEAKQRGYSNGPLSLISRSINRKLGE